MGKAKIGLFSAILLGVSSIMGSGWLFAPFKSAVVAGPAAIFSWIIGAGMVILLSYCLAEIASVFPKRGLSAIIPTLSHNKFFGFPFAIANWLGIVAVIGLEADATVQYLINLVPSLKPSLFLNGQLTLSGNFFSIALVILYSVVNYWGARFLTKANNILTLIKIIVPTVTALIIISFAFHPHNFHAENVSLIPFGFKSVLMAVVTSGIIVAFNGFQTIVSFASEIHEPHKNIRRALLWGILICLAIYLLLQVAFVGALPEGFVAQGWHNMMMNAPMVQLSLMLGLSFLASIIYFGAFIAPTGAAIAFTGSATRMFTAMSHREQMPKYFGNIHHQYNVSRRSLLMNTLLAIVFLLLFRSWSQLAQVLSAFHLIAYIPIPIGLVVFRKRVARHRYSFYLPYGTVIAAFLFALFTLLLTMIEASVFVELSIFFAVSFCGFLLLNFRSVEGVVYAFKKSYAVILYIGGLVGLNLLSPSNRHLLTYWQYAPIFLVFTFSLFYLMTRLDASVRMPSRDSRRQRGARGITMSSDPLFSSEG